MTAAGTPVDYETELRGAVDAAGDSMIVPEVWEGFPGTAFGGFLAGAVLVAAAGQTEHRRPLSLLSRYHRPAPVGRAIGLELAPERKGRTVDTFTAKLSDGERLLSTFSIAFGSDGEAPLASQALPPARALRGPRPLWQHLDDIGVESGPLMRRLGYRGETGEPPSEESPDGWHLHADWPVPDSIDPAVRAAVAVMAIDAFVGPATMRANRQDLDRPWPVMMPSLDLNGWFYALEAPQDVGWLTVRTSVPVSRAGFAVGRSQVWADETLIAEGMSQVALVPVPPS